MTAILNLPNGLVNGNRFGPFRTAQRVPLDSDSRFLDTDGLMTYAQLIRYYGSEAEAVRALGIPQSTINPWSKLGIPHWRQSHIEHATNGKLRADKRRYNGQSAR